MKFMSLWEVYLTERASSHITKINLFIIDILFGIRARVYILSNYLINTKCGLELRLDLGEQLRVKG